MFRTWKPTMQHTLSFWLRCRGGVARASTAAPPVQSEACRLEARSLEPSFCRTVWRCGHGHDAAHARGIEPRSQVWEAFMVPLHYVCIWTSIIFHLNNYSGKYTYEECRADTNCRAKSDMLQTKKPVLASPRRKTCIHHLRLRATKARHSRAVATPATGHTFTNCAKLGRSHCTPDLADVDASEVVATFVETQVATPRSHGPTPKNCPTVSDKNTNFTK